MCTQHKPQFAPDYGPKVNVIHRSRYHKNNCATLSETSMIPTIAKLLQDRDHSLELRTHSEASIRSKTNLQFTPVFRCHISDIYLPRSRYPRVECPEHHGHELVRLPHADVNRGFNPDPDRLRTGDFHATHSVSIHGLSEERCTHTVLICNISSTKFPWFLWVPWVFC